MEHVLRWHFVFAAAVSVYLLDAVTGGVVFHTTHKAAVAPLHLVHSENWIVVGQPPSPSYHPYLWPLPLAPTVPRKVNP